MVKHILRAQQNRNIFSWKRGGGPPCTVPAEEVVKWEKQGPKQNVWACYLTQERESGRVHTALLKTDHQQGPAARHRGLCSVFWGGLDGRGLGGGWLHVCGWPEPLHCSSETITTLLAGHQSVGSVAQSCPTLCNPMNLSTPGLPVHHQLPEFTQTHVHRVSDAIQPFHPLSSPSPPAPNLSQHQGLFQWVNSLHEVAKVLEFQLQHQSFQWTLRTNLL